MPADDWFGANDRIEQATLTRLQRTYAAAARDAIKKQKSFLKKVADVESGKIKPPQYYIDTNQVDKWRQGYLTEALRQQKVIDGIMADLDKAGEIAAKTIDDANADIYSATHKKQAESLQTEAIDKLGIDPDFTVYNKRQIGILIKDQQSPFSKLAFKNLGQNTAIRRKLQMSLSTAIILGESQEKILKRIQEITGQTYKQAKRVAQTERTRVQSQATHQVAEEAREMGIRTYKQWSCQMIPPTKKSKGSRDSHRKLHKRCEYTQDYFHTIWGNDLMYPGDSSAPAKEVCNCHCAYIEHVLGNDEVIEDGKVVRGRYIKIGTDGAGHEKVRKYADRGIELPDNIKRLMQDMQKEGDYVIGAKDEYSYETARILSVETGVEYAVIKFPNSDYMVRGNEKGALIPEGIYENAKRTKAIFEFHSHPYIKDLIPSEYDKIALSRFHWQTTSSIIDPEGHISVYATSAGTTESKNLQNAHNEPKESLQKLYDDLFGEKT